MKTPWELYFVAAFLLILGVSLLFGGMRIRKKGRFYNAMRGARGYWKKPISVSKPEEVKATSKQFIVYGFICILFSLFLFTKL